MLPLFLKIDFPWCSLTLRMAPHSPCFRLETSASSLIPPVPPHLPQWLSPVDTISYMSLESMSFLQPQCHCIILYDYTSIPARALLSTIPLNLCSLQ